MTMPLEVMPCCCEFSHSLRNRNPCCCWASFRPQSAPNRAATRSLRAAARGGKADGDGGERGRPAFDDDECATSQDAAGYGRERGRGGTYMRERGNVGRRGRSEGGTCKPPPQRSFRPRFSTANTSHMTTKFGL